MRLWTLHPKYLDVKGLLALWREGLLAKKVLLKETIYYINHPQLIRFKNSFLPLKMINIYLKYVYLESKKRNYFFNKKKIIDFTHTFESIYVTNKQIIYEKKHLKMKLLKRNPEFLKKIDNNTLPDVNPIFKIINGEIEPWEKI